MSDAATPNHLGIVQFAHGGRTVPLSFSYAVIHHLQQAHGLDRWMEVIVSALDDLDVASMADIMALVAGVGEEEARALCVPVLPAKAALTQAWTVGMTGNLPADDDSLEKLTPQMTLWGLLSKLRFGQASPGGDSGHSLHTQSRPSAGPTPSTGQA